MLLLDAASTSAVSIIHVAPQSTLGCGAKAHQPFSVFLVRAADHASRRARMCRARACSALLDDRSNERRWRRTTGISAGRFSAIRDRLSNATRARSAGGSPICRCPQAVAEALPMPAVECEAFAKHRVRLHFVKPRVSKPAANRCSRAISSNWRRSSSNRSSTGIACVQTVTQIAFPVFLPIARR
jgi:hypothetical protein